MSQALATIRKGLENKKKKTKEQVVPVHYTIQRAVRLDTTCTSATCFSKIELGKERGQLKRRILQAVEKLLFRRTRVNSREK